MGWGNAANVITTNIDAGSDSPATARGDLKAACDELTNVINGRGAADGVASLDSAGLVPVTQLPAVPLLNGIQVISTPGSGTWTVPAGVTVIEVEVVGAGGGGGYTSVGTGGDHGGGGGAGAFASKRFAVVPGTDFSYTIGAHGVGKANSSDGDGTAGGQTTLTSPASATPPSYTVTAGGGDKGYGPGTSNFGGAGGSASGGDVNLVGGAGASGATRGGMGGGNALVGGVAGAAGYGGAGGFGSGGGTSAFDGLDGVIIIRW